MQTSEGKRKDKQTEGKTGVHYEEGEHMRNPDRAEAMVAGAGAAPAAADVRQAGMFAPSCRPFFLFFCSYLFILLLFAYYLLIISLLTPKLVCIVF